MSDNQIGASSVTRLLYRAPYVNILMMGSFTGRIPKEAFEAALSKARVKYPLLNSRMVQNEGGGLELICDCTREFQISTFYNGSDADWMDLAWGEQKKPFDLENGPLIKFVIVYEDGVTDFVAVCHHCICDGLSLAYLMKDIAACLEDENIELAPLAMPPALNVGNLAVSVPTGASGAITGFLARSLSRMWNKDRILFTDKDYDNLYRAYWESTDIGLIQLGFSRELTAALIDRCHAEQVSVTSALITAFSLAQHDIQGHSQRYLRKALLAISIRHLFKQPPGENVGLLAMGNEIGLPTGRGGFWKAASRTNACIKWMLKDPRQLFSMIVPLDHIEPTLLDAIYFAEGKMTGNKSAVRLKNIILSRTGKPKRSMDITNLGVVHGCGANLLDLVFVPILSTNYEKTLGITTYNGRMNIVIMHNHSVIRREHMEQFRQGIVSHLENAVDR